jgi:hypothetical protein
MGPRRAQHRSRPEEEALKAALYGLLALLSAGCGATHQVKFDPWRGLAPATAQALQRGELSFSKDEAFKAASDLLDHEPFFKWDFETLDSKSGLIEAKSPAGRLRLEVAEARMTASFPDGPLKGTKDIWVSKKDALIMSAYDIEFSRREPWEKRSSAFQLDADYLASAVYRRLTDHSAVPFDLEILGDKR